MARTNPTIIGLVALVCVLLLSSAARAQQASGIAGVVRDTSGAVLPGVTVEASSPALIEKVRSAVTDGQGRYSLVDLRPGTYVVTFSLTGFATVRREGVDLSAGFTAAVNADLRVGGVEETVTVTGASPLVDVQNVRQQNVVSREVLAALPTGQTSLLTLTNLTPGLTGGVDVGGSAGAFRGQNARGGFHGKEGTNALYDGMRTQNPTSGYNAGYVFHPQLVEEMTVSTGGMSAEGSSTGMTTNVVPKEGGNTFRLTLFGTYANDHMQSDNLNDALRARGLTTAQKIMQIYDSGASLGGPIKRDRLWFYAVYARWGNTNRTGGLFWNKTQGTMFYTPDLDRPGERTEKLRSHAGRLTWQVSRRNKVSGFVDFQRLVLEPIGGGGILGPNAPEAEVRWNIWPKGIAQVTWSAPLSPKLLLEAGFSYVPLNWRTLRNPGVTADHISILETSTNFRYNAGVPYVAYKPLHSPVDRYTQRFSMSYVTGSHTFKVGFMQDEYFVFYDTDVQGGGVSYQFLRGVPIALTQYTTPLVEKDRGKADLGIFAQDQLAFKRLTVNAGLRFDYVNSMVPAEHSDAGPFVPARDFGPVYKVPEWKDFNPRLGASYDLFGDGRMALKVSLGRYGEIVGNTITQNVNPVNTSVTQVNRSWTDSNNNYVPDCDLKNFAKNGECGAISNQNFGKNNPNATRYADDVLRGWGVRQYLWDLTTEAQRQFGRGLSVTGGYYRNWAAKFRVTDNLAVTPADYSPYCITAPVDPRLPGGGGYQVCGLYDINPDKFGQVNNLVTQSSHYGKQTRVGDFFGVKFEGNFGSGIRLGGGVDTGRTVTDNCFVIDSPQQLQYCHLAISWPANTQVKLNGSYALPGDFVLSGVYQYVRANFVVGQSDSGILANYPAPTAEVAQSLGRPLSGGMRTALVPLIQPFTQFEDPRTQIDLRLTKVFRLGTKRLQANFDVYNALNANSVLTSVGTFGPSWRRPTSILDARLFQVSGNMTF